MKAFLKISGEGQNGRVPGWIQEDAKHPFQNIRGGPEWQHPRMIQEDASASLFMFLFLAQRLDLDRFLHQCIEIISGLVFQAFVDRINQCFVVLLDRDTDVDLFF